MLGVFSDCMAPVMKLVAVVVNALPKRPQEWVHRFSGALEALQPRRLREASVERIAEWLVEHYPKRKYPAVVIGASNGALVHLCAAFGMPWLPQTCLVPVTRWAADPDDAQAELEGGAPSQRYSKTSTASQGSTAGRCAPSATTRRTISTRG